MKKSKGGFRRGDIILAGFPFTDLSSHKLRPALIISGPGSDYIIVGIFSQKLAFKKLNPTWLLIEDDGSPFFKQSGLKTTSILKAEKIAVVHYSIIQRRLGKVTDDFMRKVELVLKKALQFK